MPGAKSSGSSVRTREGRLSRYPFRVLGLLVLALWVVVYLSVEVAPTVGTSPKEYPPSGDVYLTALTKGPATCTVAPRSATGTGDTRAVAVARHWRAFGIDFAAGSAVGVRVHRWFAGSAIIACDTADVAMSSGPLTWLYPLGTTFAVPLAGLVLVVVGWRDKLLPRRRKRNP